MTIGPPASDRVAEIQRAVSQHSGLDGWLFYDFRGSDPLAYRVLRLDPAMHVTRRWYYWVPRRGTPIKIVHKIETHVLDFLPGEQCSYVSWQEQQAHLQAVLRSTARIAMQYSPKNAIPYISRVDAGTLELIRSFNVEVVTSADLVQQFEAVWNDAQLGSHRRAAEALRQIVDEAFGHVARSMTAGESLTEYGLQQFILSRIRAHGLVTSSAPIAAVNAHTANPHYGPAPDRSASIREGDLVLIDLWAKQPEAGSVYADITWTGYVDTTVPNRHQAVFHIVKAARNAAVAFVQKRVGRGDFPRGWEVDDVCRSVIRQAGHEAHFVHRTGHSIGEEVHGNGANIDHLETEDDRRLLPRTCFSIEPGVYLPGEFGIRSELDLYLSSDHAEIYGLPLQEEVIPIMRLV